MKLYCKKSYYLDHYHSVSEIIFIKGNSYEAKKENIIRPCTISVATPECLAVYDVIQVINYGRTITFSQEPKSQQYKYYKDYFYTESEMRRKKLIKLSNPFNKLLKLFK